MIKAHMSLDALQFQKTLDRLAGLSTRELPTFYNSRLLAIAKNAQAATPKVERSTIEAALNVTGYSLAYKKSGKGLKKNSKGGAIFGGKLIYALVNARQRKLGEKAIPRALMASAANKFLNKRMRASGSLRAGWSRAIGILSAAIKQAISYEHGPTIRMPSSANPAKDGWTPEASMEYREIIQPHGARTIDPRVVSALEDAFAIEHAEMRKHLEDKLQEIARKAGAK